MLLFFIKYVKCKDFKMLELQWLILNLSFLDWFFSLRNGINFLIKSTGIWFVFKVFLLLLIQSYIFLSSLIWIFVYKSDSGEILTAIFLTRPFFLEFFFAAKFEGKQVILGRAGIFFHLLSEGRTPLGILRAQFRKPLGTIVPWCVRGVLGGP